MRVPRQRGDNGPGLSVEIQPQASGCPSHHGTYRPCGNLCQDGRQPCPVPSPFRTPSEPAEVTQPRGVRAWARGLRTRYQVEGRVRARWAAAGSLTDLGELTALWLTGEIAWQPGYNGPVDVDEDLAPGLTAALVACNRAGLWTHNSQAGLDGPGYRGHWRQLASVSGFIAPDNPLRDRLIGGALVAGFEAMEWTPHTRPRVVTWWNGQPHTTQSWYPAHVVRKVCPGLNRQAVRHVVDAVQVSVIDPVPGRNTLWASLRKIAGGAR